MEKSIKDWCLHLGLKNYEIDENDVVNVYGDVDMSDEILTKIPIQFGIVKGFFNCSRNRLTSLEGSPKEVGVSFYCNFNQLISLEGSPKEVGDVYNCSRNQLTSLKGGPVKVGGNYLCEFNKLITLEGGPTKVYGEFGCYGNPVVNRKFKKYNDYNHYMRSIKLKELICP
jgi:hypothetical protein